MADDAAPADAPAAAAQVSPPRRRIRAWEIGLVTLFAVLLYIPRLGSYNLWDPWEGHYGEVARRMIEDKDWVHLRWQNENFRSKPVLTFWLQAAGLRTFGVAEDGGFSGEMVSSTRVEWGLRFFFALFGVLGVVALWWGLARLVSRRVAWMASVILATSPYYFMISRQSITDMPMCGLLIAAMAVFMVAMFEEDRPVWRAPRWRWLRADWIFYAVFVVLVFGQLAYLTSYLSEFKMRVSARTSVGAIWMVLPWWLPAAGVLAWMLLRTKSSRQVHLYWFYLLNGIAILAKPPAPAIAGLNILVYLILTGEWRSLLRVELVKGILIVLVVALPWHFAMYAKDGNPWFSEYVNQHLLNRAVRGVHGDRGTFVYFFEQLGVGFWPWACFVPGALAAFVMRAWGRHGSREDRVRLMFGIWAVAGFFFFSIIQTKFHHYILPVVPGLAGMLAFWFDDLLEGRIAAAPLLLAVAASLVLITGLDLVNAQEKLVELMIYRYDRPWPYGKPWYLDYSPVIAVFVAAVILCTILAASARMRRWAVVAGGAVAIAFAVFCVQKLLVAASPHWGQRALHEAYYRGRTIHGVDLRYWGSGGITRDFGGDAPLEVRSVIPTTLKVGDPMSVDVEIRQGNSAAAKATVAGKVSKIDAEDHRFWIEVDGPARQQILALRDKTTSGSDRRKVTVDADRMIAWQLNWRGENFYAGGEIWNPLDPDRQTVFVNTDNKQFLEYIKPRIGQGLTFWVVTEKGRVTSLKGILPTQMAKDTFTHSEWEALSNKFGLARFRLDDGTAATSRETGDTAPAGPVEPPGDIPSVTAPQPASPSSAPPVGSPP